MHDSDSNIRPSRLQRIWVVVSNDCQSQGDCVEDSWLLVQMVVARKEISFSSYLMRKGSGIALLICDLSDTDWNLGVHLLADLVRVCGEVVL